MNRIVRRVACGISGGVDSAVAALILKQKGYDVFGLFMQNWDIADETGKCQVDKDRDDARMVCSHLKIPFHEVSFVKEYWNDVFLSMVKEYEQGFTPNPDVMCNKHIKFDAFFHHAIYKLGADAIATGHYARTSCGFHLDKVNYNEGVKLLTAVDSAKDQTLFLSQISQDALQRTIFPIGDLTKDVVKKIAVQAGLAKIAERKESMGICFIGSRNFSKFIEEYIEPTEGDFVHVETGKVVGKHKGTHYWTLGQRALIGGLSKAFFVVEVHPDTQEVIVAPGTDHPALFSQSFKTELAHWIHQPPAEFVTSCKFHASFRYQHSHPLIGCTAEKTDADSLVVFLDQPMRAVTPGQFAVFYQGNECLGSARITEGGPSFYALNIRNRIKISNDFS
ncbi:mitochondrial tRNA-specific 2-thiouridylase 1-like [Gigantopelta aegis]|uniref:mitochondrial tRNA-specific 2-thiouridylase 1-like n=1 Tax=Gigantopelta aegis TaxID=1735272 RepID=UPI001B88B2B1|nr:mitochondrial tRNA-specific 2-thiouridylase 1-like [Gigantopelta aegis]